MQVTEIIGPPSQSRFFRSIVIRKRTAPPVPAPRKRGTSVLLKRYLRVLHDITGGANGSSIRSSSRQDPWRHGRCEKAAGAEETRRPGKSVGTGTGRELSRLRSGERHPALAE